MLGCQRFLMKKMERLNWEVRLRQGAIFKTAVPIW